MEIRRRTSGGRGEYELAGEHGGVRASDIVEAELRIQIPGVTLATGMTVRIDSGKPRLRAMVKGTGIQLHRQIATLLLMPPPVREDDAMRAGPSILKTDGYAIERVQVDGLASTPAGTELSLGTVEVKDPAESADVDFGIRFGRVRALWAQADAFSPELRQALNEHRVLVMGGGPIDKTIEDKVRLLAAATDGDPLGTH